jgi:hypothetical protein
MIGIRIGTAIPFALSDGNGDIHFLKVHPRKTGELRPAVLVDQNRGS